MRSLAYIPSKSDKQKIYAELQRREHSVEDGEKGEVPIWEGQDSMDKKKLSKEQLDRLLQRLTQNTRKEYNTEQQTTHILAINLEIKKRRQAGDKVENRLIDYGKRVCEKKEQLAKEIQAENKLKYFRDAPEITNKAKNMNQRAIDKRLHEVIQKKIRKQKQLVNKYQPSFQPSINPQSDFINDLQNYGDLQNRMTVREKQATRRKQSLVKAIEQMQKEQCPFKPAINPHSKDIAEHMPDRKALSVATPKVRSSSQITTQISKEKYPFAPSINKNSDLLISKKGLLFEADCFRRLYNNAKDMLIKHNGKVEQRNRAYTFQPQLNNHSLKLAASIQKRPKQQTLKQFSQKGSEQEYQQIKIGSSGCDYTQKKAYSVRNTNQSCKDWQLSLKQRCINVLHRGGKVSASVLR